MITAITEVHVIATALHRLGSATAKELADATGLSVLLVTRRLKAGCFSRHYAGRLFSVVTRPDYRTGASAVWGLTSAGKEMVAHDVSA